VRVVWLSVRVCWVRVSAGVCVCACVRVCVRWCVALLQSSKLCL